MKTSEQSCKSMPSNLTSLNSNRVKGDTVHKVQAANKLAKALASDRRDDLRYNLRAKISQENYVDRRLKQFHYGNTGPATTAQ